MKKKNIKVAIFIVLTISMIYYIGWVFYTSEPTYIDNCNKKVEQFDYVSVKKYEWSNGRVEVINGIVLQVDDSKAIIKCKEHSFSDDYYELDLKENNFRIIGKGTIYHKVNNYVGFNLMLITQLFIGILCAIIIITLISTLREMLED
ncbi:MAG: hypothetical protein RLY43_557 [Bacteroidota bacterium]|jgi:hypothetical protein